MCKPKAVAGKSPDEPAVRRAVDLKGVPRDYRHVNAESSSVLPAGRATVAKPWSFFFFFPPVLVHEPGLLCAWVSAFLGFPCSPCPPSLKM